MLAMLLLFGLTYATATAQSIVNVTSLAELRATVEADQIESGHAEIKIGNWPRIKN